MKQIVKSIILGIPLLFSACTGEYIPLNTLGGTFHPNLSVPIGTISMVLKDGVSNLSSDLQSDTSSFFFEQSIDSAVTIYADSLLPELPDFGLTDSFDIGAVNLPNFTISNSMTLSQFGAAAGGTTNTIIQGLNGTTQVFPQLGPINGGSYPLQGSSPICSATINQGTCELTINNGWPTPISMVVALVNAGSGSQLANFNFLSVSPGQSATQIKSLVGKQLGSSLTLQVISMSTLGSGGQLVYINTADAITMSLSTNNIEVQEGNVIFPQSQLFSTQYEETLSLPTGLSLHEIEIQYGKIKYEITTPLAEIVTTNVLIPNSFDGFGEFGFQINTGPFLPDTGTIIIQDVAIDLVSGGAPNTFPLSVLVEIADISNCIGFDFQESVSISFSFEEVQLKSATGFFGEFSFGVADTVDLDGIEVLPGATLLFFEPEISLDFNNSIGVPIFVDLDLASHNSQGSFHADVQNFGIDYPQTKAFPRNRESSLIVSPDPSDPFIEIPGNIFGIEIDATVASTSVQSNGIPNFIQKGDDLNADITILQRSKFALSNLIITDTIQTGQLVDTSLVDLLEDVRITLSGLSVIPLDIDLTLDFIDGQGNVQFNDTLVLSYGEIVSELHLDFNQIQSLPVVEAIVLNLGISSTEFPEQVILKPDDYLECLLSLDAIVNYELEL